MLPTKSYFFFGSKIALLGGTAGDLSSLLFPILNTLWLWGQFGDFVELKAWVWPLWERGWCRGPRAGPTDRWQRRRKAVTKLWPKANLTAPLSNGTRWRTDRLYADCSTHKLETPNASISLEQGYCTLYNTFKWHINTVFVIWGHEFGFCWCWFQDHSFGIWGHLRTLHLVFFVVYAIIGNM